ncbi:MAG: VWA domain-containing protein [Deltaproteobacteria bacterium]
MKFNQALAVVVVGVFSAICAFVLVRRTNDAPGAAGPAAPGPTTAGAQAVPPPAANTLTLLLLNSVAKQAFIDRVVSDFNAEHMDVGGKPIAIKVSHGTSGEHWSSIKEGRAQPVLWSPGDESWIRIANDSWRGIHNRSLFDKAEPTVNVPLCIAMWEPMAMALGYPKPLGWADLAKISTEPQGWARYGHPEWGAFKWGHAHPDANSGFLTVLAEVYAQTRKTKDLTAADLKSPAVLEYVTKLERSVEHYGLSSVWIESFMREKGPAYLSATVQYENAIIEGNRKSQNKPFKIVAIYPKEGTVLAQHPIAIARGEWMNDELTAGAQKFVDYLLSPKTQELAMSFGIRPIRPMPVTEPISPEWGVSAELPAVPSFEVPSEDVLKRLTDLWLAAKKPASVMLLLDTSGSMAGEAMDKAKEGAVSFIEKMQARDELEIRTFSDKIFRLQPAANIASNGETARQSVRGLFASGGTHLYEVLQQGVVDWNERKKRSPDRHFGIVLMTDGQDEGSPISLNDLMDVLPKGDNPETIKIFTIAYGPKAQKNLLKEISNKSNARAFEGSVADIGRIYQELSANF